MTRRVLKPPVEVDTQGIEQALSLLDGENDFEARVNRISRLFAGRLYAENPLRGGPDIEEIIRISFDEFDCVTYVETVLALACSNTTKRFVSELRSLRYQDGKVDWFTRNHFMTGWLRQNIKRRAFTDLTRGSDTVSKTRTLSGVAGLRPRTVTFRFFPKRRFSQVRPQTRTGDMMLFVSTKKNLDVFHMGIMICQDDQVLLRHATRSAGKVIEQTVNEFLQANRMTGFIIARPLCRA